MIEINEPDAERNDNLIDEPLSGLQSKYFPAELRLLMHTTLNPYPMYYTLCLFSMAARGSNQGTSVHSPAHRPPSIITGRIPDSAEYPTFPTTVLAALCPRLYMSGLQQKSHTAIL
ncbi:hypothetical protein BDB01DRAFT_892427 [Pilobolus umbonatus]|nr:hypothetical protein BDB01DRAFT_892427 [Pilobolus umbonatus]